MATGPERLPRVDHDLPHRAVAVRAWSLPRRSHVQGGHPRLLALRRTWRSDQDRAVESLPTLLPVIGKLAGGDLDERVARERVQVGQLGSSPGAP